MLENKGRQSHFPEERVENRDRKRWIQKIKKDLKQTEAPKTANDRMTQHVMGKVHSDT